MPVLRPQEQKVRSLVQQQNTFLIREIGYLLQCCSLYHKDRTYNREITRKKPLHFQRVDVHYPYPEMAVEI